MKKNISKKKIYRLLNEDKKPIRIGKCIHQTKYCENKILCRKTGTVLKACNTSLCKHFKPTLKYTIRKLFKGV